VQAKNKTPINSLANGELDEQELMERLNFMATRGLIKLAEGFVEGTFDGRLYLEFSGVKVKN
jgi:hypothetical protein